jgi:hypothetical protein
MKTNHLMLYVSKVVVYSEIYTKHMNARCGHKVEFLSVKPDGTENNR